MNKYKGSADGVYLGINNNLSSSIDNETTNEGKWVYSADNKTGQVTLCGRNQAKGENLTLVFSPTDFVANDKISSITLSATGNATFNSAFKQYGLVIAIVDASGNIMGQKSANYTSGTEGTNMFTTLDFDNALVWQDGYKVIAGIVGPQGGGQDEYTIQNIKVSAITVPEPATATLSLMALAGLCVRRRRQRV
ncbi:MAG: PEP-CTERM sorting domain-containing protein [Akkermansia muciniphila]|nr:PEP-CTERM sorting domain-containing protein [Akkermansia muciniphila]